MPARACRPIATSLGHMGAEGSEFDDTPLSWRRKGAACRGQDTIQRIGPETDSGLVVRTRAPERLRALLAGPPRYSSGRIGCALPLRPSSLGPRGDAAHEQVLDRRG